MKVTPAGEAAGTWRPWILWLPCVLALLWSGLLFAAEGFAGLIRNLETNPHAGAGWITVGLVGHCVLAAVSVAVLVTGLRFPSRRRAAIVTAWMIIPVGLGWTVLTARLLAGS